MVEMSPNGTRVVVHFERAYAGWFDANIGTVADGPRLSCLTSPTRSASVPMPPLRLAWGPNGEEMYVSQNNRNDWIEAVDIASAATAKCSVISGNLVHLRHQDVPLQRTGWRFVGPGHALRQGLQQGKKGWVFMNTYDTSTAYWGEPKPVH